MKIGLVTTHSFPIPFKIHTGDIVIVEMAKALSDLGHEVSLFAPEGSVCENVKVYSMPCSYGKYPPSAQDCEQQCYDSHVDVLKSLDIVHDFSVQKTIIKNLHSSEFKNVCCTIMGGPWTQPQQPHNVIAWTQSHRDRILRGATDYENTPTPDLAGVTQTPVNECRVVNGGVDTNFYTPTYKKEDFFLWMNRWHPAKGYKQAIDLAKLTGIKLVMAGEHPDNEQFEFQKNCALEAIEYAKYASNVSFEWLPLDPNHHTAKRDLYRKAKALLYTVQFNEPFGLSQTEAMACGTPVIGTKYGSVPEIVINGINGFVRDNNVKNLSTAIDMIDIVSPEVCRKNAVERFDIKVMAKNYLAKYQDILNGESW